MVGRFRVKAVLLVASLCLASGSFAQSSSSSKQCGLVFLASFFSLFESRHEWERFVIWLDVAQCIKGVVFKLVVLQLGCFVEQLILFGTISIIFARRLDFGVFVQFSFWGTSADASKALDASSNAAADSESSSSERDGAEDSSSEGSHAASASKAGSSDVDVTIEIVSEQYYCDPSYFYNDTSAGCDECIYGTWSDGKMMTCEYPVTCDVGEMPALHAVSVSDCVDCAAGFYSDNSGPTCASPASVPPARRARRPRSSTQTRRVRCARRRTSRSVSATSATSVLSASTPRKARRTATCWNAQAMDNNQNSGSGSMSDEMTQTRLLAETESGSASDSLLSCQPLSDRRRGS